MKKIICGIALAIAACGCLPDVCSSESDYKCPFSRAIVKLPDGVVKEFELEKIYRFQGNVTITTTDGKEYCTSMNNVILIKD